ncbi:hypothetical protein FTV88_2965 [Heliorestis convoluta]|uniref:Uncharacterized protein n=2 Tax=Heliorestis convoluta TaxID=356322 RepID=A0A5Q2N9V1_9FIRM|nr:hypothetical protein FTV88_2965 [Heliorestis convoluta]
MTSVLTEKETKKLYQSAEAGLESAYALVRNYASLEEEDNEHLDGQDLQTFLENHLSPFLLPQGAHMITVTVNLSLHPNRFNPIDLVVTAIARSAHGGGEHQLEGKLSLSKPDAGWKDLVYHELRSKYE